MLGAAEILAKQNLDFSLVHQTGSADTERIDALPRTWTCVAGRSARLHRQDGRGVRCRGSGHRSRRRAEPGAALVLDQRKSNAGDLAAAVETLARDAGKRVAMGKAIRELARPRAAEAIVDRLETLAGRR